MSDTLGSNLKDGSVWVANGDFVPGLSKNLCDAMTHEARADDASMEFFFHGDSVFLYCPRAFCWSHTTSVPIV
ncbi:hypothetical protein EMIT0194P_360006 [Pseudomonas serbica]